MPASGPYRSRVLNILHRQTRQWVDQSTQVWRHCKVATLWSVQLLLYPVYWLFQSGRVIGKQLQQAERQVAHFRLQLEARRQPQPPLTADTPIYNVLQAVQDLIAPIAIATPEPLPVPLASGSAPRLAAQIPPGAIALPPTVAPSPPVPGPAPVSANWPIVAASPAAIAPDPSASDRSMPVSQPQAIRAIASWIETRTLVLVTAQNQVLDLLTPQQQQWLYQRLADEVAHYRRYQQVAQPPHWQFHIRLLPPKLRPTQFPPVRHFRALMAWMQQGPVAKLTNLFDEATLRTGDRWDLANLLTLPALPTLGELSPADQPSAALPPPPSWLGTLPQSASTLIQQLLRQEAAHANRPVTAIAVDLQWEGPADLWASPLSPLLAPAPARAATLGIPCPFPPSPPEPVVPVLPPSPVTAPQPGQSSGLIGAVLRRLRPRVKTTDTTGAHTGAIAANPGANPGALVTPGPAPVSQWHAIVHLVTAQATLGLVGGNSAHWSPSVPATSMPVRRSPSPPNAPSAPLIPPPPPAGPLQTAAAVAPTPVPTLSTDIASPSAPAADPLPVPSLLEVESQVMGYVKHPLEHILEWLDRVMLWIETLIAQAWRWLQARLPQL